MYIYMYLYTSIIDVYIFIYFSLPLLVPVISVALVNFVLCLVLGSAVCVT